MGISSRSAFIAAYVFTAALGFTSLGTATPVVGAPATSLSSPQPLGTTVKLTASATDTDAGAISYKYEIAAANASALFMVRDFSVDPTLLLAPTAHEANYQIKVLARNNTTGNIGTHTISFRFTSLVVNGMPAVTATANPLVALFSSPPCATGAQSMRVSILRSGSSSPSYTNWKPCTPGVNLNFVIAGMRAGTLYHFTSQTWNGSQIANVATLPFTSGSTSSLTFPQINSPIPFNAAEDSETERFILMGYIAGQFPMAVDLSGQPVWYYQDPARQGLLLTRPVTGGTVLLIVNGVNSDATSTSKAQQILREIDLAGNTIRETNATRVAEQVAAMSGIQSNCHLGGTDCLVGAFHHEALRLANGHTLVLSDEEKIFTDGTQGSSTTNPVDVIGDIILDLDANFQVAWYWRAFDHLNVQRSAVLGETCGTGNGGGCPPLFLTSGTGHDWLHGNCLYYTSADGSILFSMRHQDWIVKIDYANGSGTGNVLWTLGLGGDFTMNNPTGDAYPWFSHQHDPGFVQNGTTTLALFDNGNTRVASQGGNSRGYVLTVDQVNKVVTPVLLADLGFYSMALGTAEPLTNGDYHFEAGIGPTPTYSEAIEVTPSGSLGFVMETALVDCYRSFRLASLYLPPEKD